MSFGHDQNKRINSNFEKVFRCAQGRTDQIGNVKSELSRLQNEPLLWFGIGEAEKRLVRDLKDYEISCDACPKTEESKLYHAMSAYCAALDGYPNNNFLRLSCRNPLLQVIGFLAAHIIVAIHLLVKVPSMIEALGHFLIAVVKGVGEFLKDLGELLSHLPGAIANTIKKAPAMAYDLVKEFLCYLFDVKSLEDLTERGIVLGIIYLLFRGGRYYFTGKF